MSNIGYTYPRTIWSSIYRRFCICLFINFWTNLHDIKQALIFDIWKLNYVRRIHNTLQLDNVIGDVLERRLAINHHVKDAA